MTDEKCKYCGKKLGSTYYFSYGVPGLPRFYQCNRWFCKTKVKLKGKINPHLRKFIKRMYDLVSDV